MFIFRSFDGVNALDIRKSRLKMSNPLLHALGRAPLQVSDHPRQVGAVRFETACLSWRARFPEEKTVENQLLDACRQKLPQPGAHGKLGCICREIAQRRTTRSQPESGNPAFPALLVGFRIEVVVPSRNFIDDRSGLLRALDGEKTGRDCRRLGEELFLWKYRRASHLQQDLLCLQPQFLTVLVDPEGDFVPNRVKLRPSQ